MSDNHELLSKENKILLLKVARESLENYLRTAKTIDYDPALMPSALSTMAGAFVSLHKGRALRGCIGRFKPDIPLYLLIQELVIGAAARDLRFSPVKYSELSQLEIEISVLGELQPIKTPAQIILGEHGIYIKKGQFSGTFLPQVAKQTGWSVEEFLGHCSRDKASIGWDGWRDAELFVYSACVFAEKNLELI
jgi:AmmeMemoRadiSam system protein A